MRIRMHRGGLQESMATCKECPSMKEVVDYLEDNDIDVDSVYCELYCNEGDERIGWKKTYMILGRYQEMMDDTKSYPLAFCDTHFTIDFN